LRAVTKRQVTTFYKQEVVENHYGCLQNVVRKVVPRAEERTATTRRTSRGSTGRKRRKKTLFLRLRKKRRKVPLTWRSGQSS
jgi:hypothetical protein